MQHRSAGAVSPYGINAQGFGDRVYLGMSPSAAPLSSSQVSAKLFGIDGKAAKLEAGKSANIVAMPGDALHNIQATEKSVLMMNQGAVVDRGN